MQDLLTDTSFDHVWFAQIRADLGHIWDIWASFHLRATPTKCQRSLFIQYVNMSNHVGFQRILKSCEKDYVEEMCDVQMAANVYKILCFSLWKMKIERLQSICQRECYQSLFFSS